MIRPVFPVFLLVICLVGSSAPAFSQTPKDTRSELKTRFTRTLKALDQNSLEIRAARKAQAIINRRILKLNRSLKEIEQRKADIETSLNASQKRAAKLSASLKKGKESLEQRLRAYYLYSRDAMTVLMADSSDMNEALWRSDMLERLANDSFHRLEKHIKEKKKLKKTISRLKADQRRMSELLAWQSASIRELSGLRRKKADALSLLKKKRMEMKANLAVLKEAQKRLARTFALIPPKGVSTGHDGIMKAKGRLSPPVEGGLAGVFPNSKGVVIKAEPGALVGSPWWGEVAFAGALSGYGKVVVVDHGQRVHSVLGYLTQLSVEKGQKLEAGQTVGKAGPQGLLYLEVRRGGKPQDPRGWMVLNP